MFAGVGERERDERIGILLSVMGDGDDVSDSFFVGYQVVEDAKVITSL